MGMVKDTNPRSSWDAEAASKAYIDTVRAVSGASEEANVAELLAAMAAGSGARLIVETWACGDGAATSTGLAIARSHTGGRHVCVVPDARAGDEYIAALAGLGGAEAGEVVVGEIREQAAVEAADFLVVDCRVTGWEKVVGRVKVGKRGVMVVCRGAGPGGVPWRGVVGSDARVVRAAYIPVGGGVDMAQLAAGGEGRRWIKHIDRYSGEEHIFRR